jgi:RNA polymerase primary sigma factor
MRRRQLGLRRGLPLVLAKSGRLTPIRFCSADQFGRPFNLKPRQIIMSHFLTHQHSPLEAVRPTRVRSVSTTRQFSDRDQAALRAILTGKYETTHDKSFDADDAEHHLLNDVIDVPLPDMAWYQPTDALPARCGGKNILLTTEQERTLFLQYNYCRFRVLKLRMQIDPASIEYDPAREVLDWHRRAEKYCEQIAHSNLALVLAMAKRTRITGVEFSDLVCEGNMALLRAIAKFDVSRGFKFSTYACRAILKGYSRLAVKSIRLRTMFPTEFDPAFEKSDYFEQEHERREDECVERVRQIVRENTAGLSDLEQTVIAYRFAIGKTLPETLTLEEVGTMIGLTKERVRQIQITALKKIRATLDQSL